MRRREAPKREHCSHVSACSTYTIPALLSFGIRFLLIREVLESTLYSIPSQMSLSRRQLRCSPNEDDLLRSARPASGIVKRCSVFVPEPCTKFSISEKPAPVSPCGYGRDSYGSPPASKPVIFNRCACAALSSMTRPAHSGTWLRLAISAS